MSDLVQGWGFQVGADEICTELESHIIEHLGDYLEGLDPPKEITQGPSPDAVQAASFPVYCISSPGLAEPPTRGRESYAATWVIVVSVWVRGAKLKDTSRLTRRHVKALRSCLLAWGKGQWTDEGYAQVDDPAAAGTMGAGFVQLSVRIETAADLIQLPAGDLAPRVTSTSVILSQKE